MRGDDDRPADRGRYSRRDLILPAAVLALIAFLVWWLSMADAGMTGCGGG